MFQLTEEVIRALLKKVYVYKKRLFKIIIDCVNIKVGREYIMNLIDVKGIGNKSLSLLNSIGIHNVYDLVTYYPYRYNFLKLTNIEEIKTSENIIIDGIVDATPILRRFGKMNSLSFRINYQNKIFDVIIFNRAFLKDKINIGSFLTLIGKYNELKNNIVASDIKFKKILGEEIESIYHLSYGLNLASIRKYINNALALKEEIFDYIPVDLKNKYVFLEKNQAVYKIHNPKNTNEIKKAKLRLIYEELFLFMFKINYNKLKNKESIKKNVKKVDINEVHEFIRLLPFELTTDQLNASKEIYEDLMSNKRMNRMLQGDVGSGKTIVSVIATYINFLTGRQTALMAPTEVLAYQHYNTIKEL